ncbi:MAG: DUF6132 family protein [Bacteroidia bacterium]|nr:DUF6132 family protein [Bacteroidia bacterium]MDW8347728.1 DUF6132 family protein [Bacteroidia bacterium]
MIKKILKYKLTVIGVILGLLAGYIYYYHVGCTSGSCPITSKPLNSTIYGGILGGLFFNLFEGNKI